MSWDGFPGFGGGFPGRGMGGFPGFGYPGGDGMGDFPGFGGGGMGGQSLGPQGPYLGPAEPGLNPTPPCTGATGIPMQLTIDTGASVTCMTMQG